MHKLLLQPVAYLLDSLHAIEDESPGSRCALLVSLSQLRQGDVLTSHDFDVAMCPGAVLSLYLR